MQKITINDFSGGIQESTVPNDFTPRQWAQLKGVIPDSQLNFESQWPIQTIGSSVAVAWTSVVFTTEPTVPTSEDGAVGTYWFQFVEGEGSPVLYGPKQGDDSWPLIGDYLTDWQYGTTVPTFETPASPIYYFQEGTPTSFLYVRTDNGSASNQNFTAVYPLVASSGTYLAAIKDDGTLWWAESPDATANYTTANSVVWTEITTASNVDENADPISVLPNEDYKFICSIPLQTYKYVTAPDEEALTNPSKDSVYSNTLEVTSSVLLHSTTLNGDADQGPQQAVVLYVDPTELSIKAATFPNLRRTPMHDKDAGDFIKAYIGNNTYAEFPTWLTDTDPYRAMHPYTYLDINAALLPGRGIIPRANVGVSKNGLLLLGDIEWRSDLSADLPTKTEEYIVSVDGYSEFDTKVFELTWPAGISDKSRVIYSDSEAIYLKDDANMVGDIIDYSTGSGVATFTTELDHGFITGETVEVSSISGLYNGTYVIDGVPTTNSFEVVKSGTHSSTAQVITDKEADGTYATLTTTTNHTYFVGKRVYVADVGAGFDGYHEIVDIPSPTTFTFALADTVAPTGVSGFANSPVGRAVVYKYKVALGFYQTIPDSWGTIYLTSSVVGGKAKAVNNLNTAYHQLNDTNTGPHRGSIYFSNGGDIDMFDPRAVLTVGKTDVTIVGMHTLDDTLIAITTAGSNGDGVHRIRGYINRLIQYGTASDTNAVRIELIRGGIGAPQRTATTHKNYSTVWSEAGVVVFIDRLGGVWYTNGKDCDRLDRYGPKTPTFATEDDHVAELGKNLFVWRNNRLLCFTMMETSPEARKGNGSWTEINAPSNISSMIGGGKELFFVSDGRIMRMSPMGPDAERACIDGSELTITISTLTAGDVSNHRRTNWHKFGMTFTTPTSCSVDTVRVQSTGALNISGSAVSPDVQYVSNLSRTYDDMGILGEFVVNTGIGPQAVCSATTTFRGYVQLQSASFWVTGTTPRVGDK
jgi:hypothetical protein